MEEPLSTLQGVIDLHTHSRFSDGSDSPAELARLAANIGITSIALTDHDTTASHDEMVAACNEFGLELIAGVEVSVKDLGFSKPEPSGELAPINVHVLAYFVPTDQNHPFQVKLRELRVDRERRNASLVTLLNDLGFTRLTLEYLTQLAGNLDNIGRPHFARAMFELHPEIVGERDDRSWSRLFVEWLGHGGKAYLPKTHTTIEEFVAAGAGAGVVFSIAHPLVNYVATDSHDEIARVMPAVLESLRGRGIQGVEAYYGSTSEETRRLMLKLTRDAGMIPTGGSDYHGSYKPDVALGRGRTGDLNVPDSVLNELKAARN